MRQANPGLDGEPATQGRAAHANSPAAPGAHPPPSHPARLSPWCSTHAQAVAIAALVALASLATAAVVATGARQLTGPPTRATTPYLATRPSEPVRAPINTGVEPGGPPSRGRAAGSQPRTGAAGRAGAAGQAGGAQADGGARAGPGAGAPAWDREASRESDPASPDAATTPPDEESGRPSRKCRARAPLGLTRCASRMPTLPDVAAPPGAPKLPRRADPAR